MSRVVRLPDWSYHWAANVSSRSYDVNHPTMQGTRAEPLIDLIRHDGGRRALACPDDGSPLTYDRLAAEVLDIASRLRSAGVGRGDRVAVVLPNGPEIIELLFALAALGATMAPLNPAYTEPEYRFYLDDLAPQLLVVGAGTAPTARAAAEGLPIVELVSGAAGQPPRLELEGRSLAPATFEDGRADDAVLLLHTSGTTSRPKQVPLLQRNLTAQARSIANHYGLTGSDVSFCAMPLFHVHGLVASTLAQLAAGGTVVVPRRLVPGRFWGQAREYGMTWHSASPTPHQKLIARLDEPPPTLRFVRSCSSALSAEMMRDFEARLGVPMVEAYGMTENTHQMTSNPLPPADRRPGSVGVSA